MKTDELYGVLFQDPVKRLQKEIRQALLEGHKVLIKATGRKKLQWRRPR